MKQEAVQIKKFVEESGVSYEDRKAWLQQHQLATNRVIESLGGREVVKEQYGEIAQKWNSAGLPPADKAKYVLHSQVLCF